MFRPILLSTLLVALPAMATAQSGTVRYTETTPLDFKLPPNSPMADRLPKTTSRFMQLAFTPDATIYSDAPRGEGNANGAGEKMAVEMSRGGGSSGAVFISRDGGGMAATKMDIAAGDMVMMGGPGFFFGGSGAGGGTLSGAFTNLASGDYVEVREFLGKTFRIPDARPSFQWKLTGEQAMFLGHPVLQARAVQDSTALEAWFTPDIPVSAGPAQFGGLPGLILTLTVDSNKVVYTATNIDLTTPVAAIKAPSDGSKVTREEYNRIVKEKMDEMAKSRRGRGN